MTETRLKRVLIVGGSSDIQGGIEAFCDRSTTALGLHGGWQIERIAADTAYLTIRGLPNFFRGAVQLFRARHQRPDCVWLQYGTLPDLGYLLLAKLLGMRVMVTPHLGLNWRSQTDPVLRTLGGWLLRLADRLALISKTQEIELNLPAKVPRSLIRNFLPNEILTAPLPDNTAAARTIELIHSGRLSSGKGSFLVIDLCERLRDAGVPFTARITGGADKATFDRLAAMIAAARLEDHVQVLGRISEEALFEHLRRSDVLIHLSTIDSYPLIVLEAMASSVVPVCLELAGARDMVETYGGHIVGKQRSVDDAARWLEAQDLDTLRATGERLAGRVRSDYDWSRCARALDAALHACVAEDRLAITQPEPVP